jgi:hypothetical protein
MDTGLFLYMSTSIKIEDFEWLHTKIANLDFFEMLAQQVLPHRQYCKYEENRAWGKIGVGWNYNLNNL